MKGHMTDTGWYSSYSVLCNCQCVKCGIWLGQDEKKRLITFEGMPHHCKPAEALREYERRRRPGIPGVPDTKQGQLSL